MAVPVLLLTVCLLFAGSAIADDDSAYVAGSRSLVLDEQTFADTVAKHSVIVFFHGPGCAQSQQFVPKFERLAERFADVANVRFGNVNCDEQAALCERHQTQAYDLVLFPSSASGARRVTYLGVRDADGLARFVLRQLGDDVLDGSALDVPRSLAAINELTDQTFGAHVAVGEHFVKFYAPWCGHCQRLAPTWDDLATAIEADQSVSVSKIDCTQFRPICAEFEVKGYPSLLWIVDGKRVAKYTGSRTLEDLKAYVEQTSSARRPTDATPAADAHGTVTQNAAVLVLNEANFRHVTDDGLTLVKFYAPWCGHCKRLAPRWDELAAKFAGSSRARIAKVDCSDPAAKAVCSEQAVNGFPTIYAFRNGERIDEYLGNRSVEDMYEFVQRFVEQGKDEL